MKFKKEILKQVGKAIDNGCDSIEISNLNKNGYLFVSSSEGSFYVSRSKNGGD